MQLRAWFSLAALLAGPVLAVAQAPRSVQPFDQGWLFQQSDVTGGEAPTLPDTAWKPVSLPHDWAIAGPFDESNPSKGQGGFAPAGVGWYRKHFTLPPADASQRVYLEFDGVMANSDVWINGTLLGHRPSGYVSFRYDLTGKLKFGSDQNIVAVRADNSQQPSSRWYEGAGIYRHVRLIIQNPVHIAQWASFVTTPQVSAASARVRVQTTVINQAERAAQVQLKVTLLDPTGKPVGHAESAAQPLAAGAQLDLDLAATVANPDRWDIAHGAIYSARLDVLRDGKVSNEETVNFGIREFHFDPNTGFWLNGRNLKIKGVALHFDVGSLGTVAPLGAWEHRLAAMRTMGANAIRTAHNPFAPDFLDLCDRMGFLVMDEMFDQWTVAKNPYDFHLYFKDWYLHDVRDTVMRDRNHPGIILYSAGNEIHDTPNAELARSILAPMVAEFHRNDPTRPVTQALFRPNASHDYDDGLADLLDVIGQNYRPNEILAAHAQKPTRKIIGTENTHGLDQWLPVRDHPEYSGEFLWAGVDYLGEARNWPFIGSGGGMADRTDALKPDGLERESWWASTPVVHVVRRVAPERAASTDPGYEPGSPQALALGGGAPAGSGAQAAGAAQAGSGARAGARPSTPAVRPAVRPEEFGRATAFADWTPRTLTPHDETVEVYSNCPQVELFLNDKSLGSKPRDPEDHARKWTVSFAPGTLRAVGQNGASACATESLRTADKPAKLILTVERAKLSSSWDDVAYVRATVVDEQGTIIPNATPTLTFSVSGPGIILATDSGDNADHSGFQHPDRVPLHGSAIAILRATQSSGKVVLTVTATGLAPASATLPITP